MRAQGMKRPILKLASPPAEKPSELLPWSALVVPISMEEAVGIIRSDMEKNSLALGPGALQTWAEPVRQSWADLQQMMKPGDQLWTYQTGPTWLADGLALVRKRRIIAKVELRRRHRIPFDRMR
jgi:hypothetical protein